jgi:hypothetical protein
MLAFVGEAHCFAVISGHQIRIGPFA